ncbi:hypothetical protein BJV78DRAFT_729633 [Lactifluus subvellereus]|nr:hypothetical protein BJV78DRAFT_729633 [Lactifluus subvellereus]
MDQSLSSCFPFLGFMGSFSTNDNYYLAHIRRLFASPSSLYEHPTPLVRLLSPCGAPYSLFFYRNSCFWARLGDLRNDWLISVMLCSLPGTAPRMKHSNGSCSYVHHSYCNGQGQKLTLWDNWCLLLEQISTSSFLSMRTNQTTSAYQALLERSSGLDIALR